MNDKNEWVYSSPLGTFKSEVDAIMISVWPDLKLTDQQLQALSVLLPKGNVLQNQSGRLTITPDPSSLFAARRMGVKLGTVQKSWPGTRFRPFKMSPARMGEQSYVSNRGYSFQEAGQPLEIVEHRFASAIGILRGLVDGKIQAADRIFPWELGLFQNRPGVVVRRYKVPTASLLLLNSETEWLQHREMRMAISGGIHRKRILKLDLSADRDDGRPLTAPFPVAQGYDESLSNFEYEPRLMVALKSLIEKRMGGKMRKLRLAYWPSELSNRAAFAIRDQLQLGGEGIGIELRPLEVGEVPDRDWDLLLMIWPAMDPLATLPQLRPWMQLGGPRIQKLLAKLETATSVAAASDTLKQLHQAIYQELPLIPLWQSNEYFVKREQLKGTQPTPVTFYDDVTKWRYSK